MLLRARGFLRSTFCLLPFACVSTLPALAQAALAKSSLAKRVDAIVNAPGVARAHWGIAVTTLDGTPVYSLNDAQYFRPASNAKLFTTAAAMHLLGPEARVTTRMAAQAISQAGTVDGDIVLYGAGDANLSARHLPYETAAARKQREARSAAPAPPESPLAALATFADGLVRANVKTIHGDIVGDDTLWPMEPYPSDWSIDDAVWGYGAPVSALTVTDNQLQLTVAPGANAGDLATVSLLPALPYYTVRSEVTTVAANAPASVRIDRDPGSRTLRLLGTIAVGKPDVEEIAIADPADYAAVALKSLLENDGIQVTGVARAQHRLSSDADGFTAESRTSLPSLPKGPRSEAVTVSGCLDNCGPRSEHVSPTLADDVSVTLKVSQNLHAELLLRRLGKQYGTEGSSAQGARVVRQFLLNAGLNGDDFVFYDGSGLSSHDLVTPRATAKLLAYAATQPWFTLWRAGLPVGGVDGSLAGRFTEAPLKSHVFAKTGTLGESRALSGYVDCHSGRTVVFSILVDNHTPATSADRDAMDAIVAAIAAEN